MNKIKVSALLGAATILLSAYATPSLAGGLAIGVTGSGNFFETTGTETTRGSNKKTTVTEDGAGALASGFIQYTFGNEFVVGLEKIPGAAEFASGHRTDTDGLKANDTDANRDPGIEQSAKAEIGDHLGIYVETPGFGAAGFFLKLGAQEVTIETKENLGTGGTYGNETLYGGTVGLGFKGTADMGLLMKLTAEYTEYEEGSLASSSTEAGTKVDWDTEQYGIKLAVGYQF